MLNNSRNLTSLHFVEIWQEDCGSKLGLSGVPMLVRILSVSRNTHLLVKRNDALAMAGHFVRSPRTPEDAPALLAQDNCEVVIIGHSVSHEQRKEIIPALRQVNPAIPIVFVYSSPESGDEPLADLCVDVADDTAELVKALEKLNIRSKARAVSI